MRAALTEHVPYLEERRRGRKVYFYFRPKGSACAILGVKLVPLAKTAPRTASYQERLRLAISEAKELYADLERRRKVSLRDPASVEGTLPWVISQQKAHPKYLELSAATRERTYECWFRLLEKWSEFNHHPDVRTLTTPIIQRLYEELTAPDPDTGERKISKGRNVIVTLKKLLGYAKTKIEGISHNPAEDVIMASKVTRHTIWTDNEIRHAKDTAGSMNSFSIALGIELAHNLGQRRADLVDLRVRQWNGTAFEIVQKKTGQFIKVPALPALRDALNALIQENKLGPDDCFLLDPKGHRFTGDSFYDEFVKVVRKAGIKDRWFHDLRRTCVVRLARAGLTVPEICAITGHTLLSAHNILQDYLPRDAEVAARGMKKLQRHEAKKKRRRA